MTHTLAVSWYVPSEKALEYLERTLPAGSRFSPKLFPIAALLLGNQSVPAIRNALQADDPGILERTYAALVVGAAAWAAVRGWEWLTSYSHENTYFIRNGFTRDVRKPEQGMFKIVIPVDAPPSLLGKDEVAFMNGVNIKGISKDNKYSLAEIDARYNGHDLHLVKKCETDQEYHELTDTVSSPHDFWMLCGSAPRKRLELIVAGKAINHKTYAGGPTYKAAFAGVAR